MNYAKILGNTIAAFSAAAIGINLAGAHDAIIAAFYVAGITALLALAKELQEEGLEEDAKCKASLTPLLLF